MDNTTIEKNQEIEIDLGRVFRAVLDRAWLVALATVLCTVIAYAGTVFFLTPQYKSTAMFYVNNSAQSLENTSQSISSSDISAGKSLVESYLVILNTNATLQEIIDYAGVDYSCANLADRITAEPVNSTAIFAVTVKSPDPIEAAKLADAIAHVLPERIAGIIEGSSAIVVDYPVVANNPSSPNYVKNTMLGGLFGFILSVGLLALHCVFDITIRTDEDIIQNCAYPVLTHVPNMTQAGSNKGRGFIAKKTGPFQEKSGVVGGKMSFAASEAYKLLRTKIQFSFADDSDCHVIGICSGLSGEGKSLTAVNLAYTLSQLNHRVLLVDCDMRKSSVAEKLRISKRPGLSEFLTKQVKLESVLQDCGILQKEAAFHVISAGQNPPNPAELLDSSRMVAMLRYARTKYDYIILDLPPVGEVSDAMVVAKETDGILLVVRKDYCNRQILTNTVRQFEFIQAKILGVVCNYASGNEETGSYARTYGTDKKKDRRS